MKNNWYRSGKGSAEAAWYAPAPVKPEQKKKRRWWLLPLILVPCILTGAAAYVLTQYAFPPYLTEPLPSGLDQPEPDYPADFREMLNEYYTPIVAADECTISRFEASPGMKLSLSPLPEAPLSLNELYVKCSPSIVGIRAYEEPGSASFFWGTGVVFTANGYIVTNSHIIEGTASAEVLFSNGDVYEASLVGNDSRGDIAVLKIDAQGLTPAEFTTAECSVGDNVVAIGNPLQESFSSTMTEGIISGINRNLSYNGANMTLLQTTAPINSGNSGGALFNMYGQVIGITNMKMSTTYLGSASIEGIGFAIPTQTVQTMTDSILACGKVLGRPALGISVGAIPQHIREHYSLPAGLYVSSVYENSGFADRDIRVGDIIIAMDGNKTEKTTDVTLHLSPVGTDVTLTVWRMQEDGTPVTFDVVGPLVDVADVY